MNYELLFADLAIARKEALCPPLSAVAPRPTGRGVVRAPQVQKGTMSQLVINGAQLKVIFVNV